MFVYGKITESIEVLRAGLKKYPDSYILMENLAFHLESDEQMENHNEEIISLYKKVLEGTTGAVIQNRISGYLCGTYARNKRYEEAKALAQQVPELMFTKGECKLLAVIDTMEWVDEASVQANEAFHKLIKHLSDIARFVKYAMNDDEAVELWRKVIIFIESFYEDSDCGAYIEALIEGCGDAALRSARVGKYGQALDYLEKAIAYIENADSFYEESPQNGEDYAQDKQHTSIVPRFGQTEKRYIYIPYLKKKIKQIYTYTLTDKAFGAVCSTERFENIESRLCKIVDAF